MSSSLVAERWPTLVLLAPCAGLATSVVGSPPRSLLVALVLLFGLASVTAPAGPPRLVGVAVVLGVVGLAWGGQRMDVLRQSALGARAGETASARIVVTSQGRPWGRSTRVFADIVRFGSQEVRERVLAELPDERAPPRGTILDSVRAQLRAPRGPETGFDERGWLARRGVHVVVRLSDTRAAGRRGGIGGVADRLRAHVERSLARGASGERLALLRGIVLGVTGGAAEDPLLYRGGVRDQGQGRSRQARRRDEEGQFD